MLRIVAHKSAAAALKYYTEGLQREDYYSEGQEIVGKWYGKAAERLGLEGRVERKDFAALVENRHPVTGEKLTPRMKADRRVGYDLNFHAPKSLSILQALTGDERIVEAFRAAVAETMAEIETLAATRVRKRGAQGERVTGNLVWAEFVHFTARPVEGMPGDPHLHIHGFAMNQTWDSVEEKWKAVSWAEIKKDAPYSQAVFHSRLAAKVAELGYGIERTKAGWEIAGIPRSLIEKFSRRGAQIEGIAAKKGITDPKAKDALGALSREGKRHGMKASDLVAEWSARLTPDEKSLISKIASGEKRPPSREKVSPALAHEEACEKLFAKNSVVQTRRLLAEALHFGVGHVTPEQAWREFQRRNMIERYIGGESLCTTVAVLAEEVSLINFVRNGRGMHAPLGGRRLKPVDERLSKEQALAVRHILKSRDQVIGVRGGAGVGKTTGMSEAVKHIEAAGFRVFAFAPSASASRDNLRKAGFANAQTVAHLLANKELQKHTRGQVIWVDEAGTLGTSDMLELMRIAGKSTRLIFTGDTAQHAPVPRGDAFRLIQHYAGLRVVEITEIRRQEREDYKRAVAALSKGDLRTAFRALDEMGAILEISDDDERYRQLAEDFLRLSRKDYMPLVVSPTHAEGATVTAAIRDAMREAGKLGPEREFVKLHNLQWEAPDRRLVENYREGLVVQFNQNSRGIKRGSAFHVTGVDENGAVLCRSADGSETKLPLNEAKKFQVFEPRGIELARGDRIRITLGGKSADEKRLNNGDLFTIKKIGADGKITLHTGAVLDGKSGLHLTHGLCVTSHSAQSKSVRDVLVAQNSEFGAGSMEQFYVSVSRGKESIRIYTENRLELQQAVGNTSARKAGIELAGIAREVSNMSEALNEKQFRDWIQSRKQGEAMSHEHALLNERRYGGIAKAETQSFAQYIQTRRANAESYGRIRSKAPPSPKTQQHSPLPKKEQSVERSAEPKTEKTAKPREANLAQRAAAASQAQRKEAGPRQSRIAKSYLAAANHFRKVADRVKGSAQSIKKGAKPKAWLQDKAQQLARHRIKRKNNVKTAMKPTKAKTIQKAPTPVPRRIR